MKLAEVVSYSSGILVLSSCALKFKYVVVKSLMIGDERVGEEAEVEHRALFIRHGRSSVTVCIWCWVFGHSLGNNTLRVNVPRCHASFFKKVASSRQSINEYGSDMVSVP